MDTKALRQKILDLAIRGKLVPQDPNDEPASVLLERIREQKKQMVKEGKLKAKDIKNDTIIFVGEDNLHYEKFQDDSVRCIEDEIPFDLPEGWAWTRLKNIFNVCSSKRVLQSDWKTDGIPFYRAREIVKLSDNGFVNNELFISEEHFISLSRDYGVPQPGDLMVSGVGTIGKVYIVKSNDRFYYKDASVLCFENRTGAVHSEFARILLESSFIQAQMKDNSKGTTVDTITISTAMNYLCILPPAYEQERIIQAVQNALVHVEKLQMEKENLHTILSVAKSKILDLAIRGKLVPQDPNDEPASVLLDRIRTEKEELINQGKIKRDKKESIIFRGDDNSYYEKIGDDIESIDAEIPFNLPDNWIWCRGYSCFSGMESTKPQGEFFDYIDIDSIDNRSHCVKKTKHIPVIEAPSRASRAINSGSVLFSLVRPYLENIALIEEIHSHSIASTGFYVCNSNGLLLPEYMFYLMISKYVVDGLNQYMKGDNSPSISKNDIENWLYPIPPIAEQKRICYILKSTYAIIEKLEESLI